MSKSTGYTLYSLLVIVLLSACGGGNSPDTPSTITETASSSPVPVNITSSPLGADVIVDGQFLGQTFLQTSLLPGTYLVEFQLEGFIDAAQEVNVIESYTIGVSQTLKPEAQSSLIQLEGGEPQDLEWDINENRLYYRTTSYGSSANVSPDTYSVLDLNNGETSIEQRAAPLNWLNDTQLRETLGILDVAPNSISNTAYSSPSGKYVAYTPQSETPYLAFYDVEQQIILQADIPLPTQSSISAPEYRLHWSPNESIVWIQRGINGCAFVLLEKETAKTIFCLREFHSLESSEQMFALNIVSPPSNGANTLVRATNAESELPSLWLVNVESLTGESIPIENPLDAAFSANGQTIYIAHSGGISRASVSDPSKIELVTDQMKSWNLRSADFSPNAEYVLLEATTGDASFYWVYKLPQDSE